MKPALIAAIAILSFFTTASAQVSGSFYTMQLGTKTALFKYVEWPDSIQVVVDQSRKGNKGVSEHWGIDPVTLEEHLVYLKDTVVTRKALSLMDTTYSSIRVKHPLTTDSIVTIDPISLTQRVEVNHHYMAEYHTEIEMSYFDFLLMLKEKFEIKNPQKRFRVSSFFIYYESPTCNGRITIDYPQTYQGVVSRLNCLDKGGLILLDINTVDHNNVTIYPQNRFIALIRIKK